MYTVECTWTYNNEVTSDPNIKSIVLTARKGKHVGDSVGHDMSRTFTTTSTSDGHLYAVVIRTAMFSNVGEARRWMLERITLARRDDTIEHAAMSQLKATVCRKVTAGVLAATDITIHVK